MKSSAALRAELELIQSSSSPIARGSAGTGRVRGVPTPHAAGAAAVRNGRGNDPRPGTSHARTVAIEDGLGALLRRPPTQNHLPRGSSNNLGRIGGGGGDSATGPDLINGSSSPSPRREQANGADPVTIAQAAGGNNSLMSSGFSMLAREYLAVGFYEGAQEIAQKENDVLAWVAALMLSGNAAKAAAIIETSIIIALVTTYCKWRNIGVKPFSPFLAKFFKSGTVAAGKGNKNKSKQQQEELIMDMIAPELVESNPSPTNANSNTAAPTTNNNRGKKEESKDETDYSTLLGIQVDSKEGTNYLRIDFRTILQCVAAPSHPCSVQYLAALPKPTEEESSMLKDAIGAYISVDELTMWYLMSVILQYDFKPPVNIWTKRFFGLLTPSERLLNKKNNRKSNKYNELVTKKSANGRRMKSVTSTANVPLVDIMGADGSAFPNASQPTTTTLTRADVEDLLISQMTMGEIQVVQAYTSFQHRRFHSAIEVATDILDTDPNDFPMRYIRCICALKIGDRKTANEDCLIMTKSVSRFVCAVGLSIATYALPNKNALLALRDIKLTKEEESYVFGIGEWAHGTTILHLGNFGAARAIAQNAIPAVAPKSKLQSWLYDIEFTAALALRDRNTLLNIPLPPLRALHLSLVPYFGGGFDNPSFNRIEMNSAVGKLLNPPYEVSNYIDARHAVPLYYWQSRSMFSFGRLQDAWQVVLAAVSAAEELLGSAELCLCDCAPHRVLILGINIGLALLDDTIERGGTQDVDPSDREAVEKRAADDQLGDEIMMLCRMWAKKLRYHHPRMVSGYCAVTQVAIAAQEPNNVERAATISDSFPQSVLAQNLMPYALFSRHLIPDAIASARRTLHRFPHVPEVRSLFEIVSNRVGSYSHAYRSIIPIHYRFADDSPKILRTVLICVLMVLHIFVLLVVSVVNLARWRDQIPENNAALIKFSKIVEVNSFIPMGYGALAILFSIVGVLVNRSLISFAFLELHFRDTPLQRLLFCLRGVPYANIAHAFLIWWDGSDFLLSDTWVGFPPLILAVVCVLTLPFSTRVFFLRSMDEPDDGFTFWLSMLFMDLITFIAFFPLQCLAFVIEPVMFFVFFIFMPSVSTAESGDVKIRLREQHRSNKVGSRRWVVGSGSKFFHLLILRLLYLDTHSALETTHALRKQEEEDDYRAFPLVFMLEPPSAAPRETPTDRAARVDREAEEARQAREDEANGAKPHKKRDKQKKKSVTSYVSEDVEMDDVPAPTAVTLVDLGYKFGADDGGHLASRNSGIFTSTADFSASVNELDGDGVYGDIWDDDLFGDILFEDASNVSDEDIGDFTDDEVEEFTLTRHKSSNVLPSAQRSTTSALSRHSSFKIEKTQSPAASPRLDVPNPLVKRSLSNQTHLSADNNFVLGDDNNNTSPLPAKKSKSQPRTIGDMFATKNNNEDDAIFCMGGLRNKIVQQNEQHNATINNNVRLTKSINGKSMDSNSKIGSIFAEANEDAFDLSDDSLEADFTSRVNESRGGRKSSDNGNSDDRNNNSRPKSANDKFNSTWGRVDVNTEVQRAHERDQQAIGDDFELSDEDNNEDGHHSQASAPIQPTKARKRKSSLSNNAVQSEDDELSFLYPQTSSNSKINMKSGQRRKSGSAKRQVSESSSRTHSPQLAKPDLNRQSSSTHLGVEGVPSRTGSRGNVKTSPRADKTMGSSTWSNNRPTSASQLSGEGGNSLAQAPILRTPSASSKATRRSAGTVRPPSSSALSNTNRNSNNASRKEESSDSRSASRGVSRERLSPRDHRLGTPSVRAISASGRERVGSASSRPGSVSDGFSPVGTPATGTRRRRRLVPPAAPANKDPALRPVSGRSSGGGNGMTTTSMGVSPNYEAIPLSRPSGSADSFGAIPPIRTVLSGGSGTGVGDLGPRRRSEALDISSDDDELNFTNKSGDGKRLGGSRSRNKSISRTNSNRSLSKGSTASKAASPSEKPIGRQSSNGTLRRGSMRKQRTAPNIASVVSPLSGAGTGEGEYIMKGVQGDEVDRVRTAPVNGEQTNIVLPRTVSTGRLGRTKSSNALATNASTPEQPPSEIVNANIKIRKVLDDLRIAKQMVGSLLNPEHIEKQLYGAKIKFVQDVARIGKKISVETYESKKQLLQLFEETMRDGDEVLGNVEVMKCLLNTIVSLDLGGYISNSELHVQAATKGYFKFLEMFLQNPTVLANLDIRTIETLLGKCVRFVGVPRRVACLLAIFKGLKDSNLARNRADDMLMLWHAAIEQVLSSGNVPPNYSHFSATELSQRRELFQIVVKHPYIPFNLTTKESSDKQTIFSRACREGDAPLVITILQNKKENPASFINRVQSDGTNALQQAAARGHLDVVKLLLLNPNIPESVHYEFPGRGTALQLAINMKRDPKMIQMLQAKLTEIGPKKDAAEAEEDDVKAALLGEFERYQQLMKLREKKAADGTTQIKIMVSVLRPTYEQLISLRRKLKSGKEKKKEEEDEDDELDFSDPDDDQQAGVDMTTMQEINRLSEITAQQKQNMIVKIPRLGEDVLITKDDVKKDVMWLLDQLFQEPDEKDNNASLTSVLLAHLAVNFNFQKLAIDRQWIATSCENGCYMYLETLLTKIPFIEVAIQDSKGSAIEEILDGCCESRIHRIEVLYKLMTVPEYKTVLNFRKFKFALSHSWQRVGEQILSGLSGTSGEIRKSFPELVQEIITNCERGYITIDFVASSVKMGNHSIFSKACEVGNVDLIKALLMSKNLVSKAAANALHPVSGLTPLMYALYRGHTPSIKALLETNPGFISVDIPSPKLGNKTALQLAEELAEKGKLSEAIVELIATAD